ncbi:MAG: stage II sporulation protein M [Bacillota bacterium]
MNGYPRKSPGRLTSAISGGWPVYLTVLLVLAAGLLVGSMSAGRLDKSKSQELSVYVRDFIQKVDGVKFQSSQMARNAMINNVITVAAIYILGLTVIGIPVTLAILFVRGFVIGFAAGFLTGDMSVRGVLLTAAAILPHNLLYIPAVSFGAASSVMFGILLWKRNFDSGVPVLPGLIKYTGIMCVVLLVSIGAGLVEGYVTPHITKMAAGFISSDLFNR